MGLVLGAQPKAPTQPPLAYFADHCQRCHGEQGSQYDPTLGKGKTDAWLVQEVTDMADGPGQGSLSGEDLKAEVAFHRSLILKEPFAFVSKFGSGAISGEALPKSTVTVVVGGKRIPAKLTETSWAASVPASASLKNTVVEVKLGGKVTRLALAKGMYSHASPLRG